MCEGIIPKLFTRYVQTVLTEEEKEIFVDKYNRCFNNNVEPDYSKLPLFVNGMNYFKNGSEFKLFEQQIKGAAFLSNKGNGLLAYEVGVGKTATGIVATVNQIQTGRASRPLIVVPKSVIKAWEKDINELFPSIPLNVLDNMSMKAIGKYYDGNHGLNIPAGSITLVTKEALNNFAFTAETIRNDLFNDYADLLSLNEDLESDNARIRAIAQERIFSEAGCSNFVKNGDYILWEKTGFDHITVDEAHAFKNLFKVPRPKKGEVNEFSAMGSGNPSKRALKMFNITQLIQKHNEDRNVFMLTATPFTNSPLEVYSMLTYIARKELEKQGIKDLYSFCQQYASTEYELAITQKNTVEYRNVMKGFNDVTSLQNTLKQYIDKVSAEEALVIRPKKITHPVYLQPTELQNEIFDFAQNNLMNYQPKINEKRAPTLEGLNIMNLATLSPALVNEELLVDPKTHTSLGIVTPDISEVVECSPKLKAVCDTVVKNWKEHKDCGQVIYMNVGTEAFPYMIKYMENHGIPKEVFARIDGQEVVMGGKKVPGKTEARETVAQAFNDDKNPCKILIGSSAISEGMNLNGNSIALYNLTLGWNPTESVQVEGRIWRQGNQQGHVHIVYPLIENSCDPFLYQKHDEKMSRIDDLFSYKGTKMIIDGINPEDAKWALIKDPGRRADLEITEKLAVLNKEMLMYENQLSDYDSLIKSRKDFSERLESKKKQKEEYVNNYQQSLFSGNARRTEDEQQQGIERFNKSINDCEKQLSNITAKFLEMGIENSEDEITYSSKINEKKAEVQKKVDFLKSDENKTVVVEKYRKQIQNELLEKNERLQKSPLHESILNDLVPFSVVEYQVQRERYENALKNRDKNPEEFIKAEKRWNDFIKKRNNEEIEKPSSQKNETKDNDKKVLSETTREKSEKPVVAEKIITADAASEPKKNKSVIQLSLFEELSLGNIQEKKRAKEEEKMKTKPKVYREEEKNKQLNIAPEADKQEKKMENPSSENISYENEEYWKTQFLNDNVETFKALDDFLNNGIKPKNDEFIFSKVPEILKSANVSENEIVIRTSIINKARNEHSLSADEIRKAIENIAAPVLIFDSDKKSTENKKNSYLSLTDTFAKNGKPVAFSMNLDSEYERKNRIIEVNEIRTIHERTLVSKNGVDLIQKWTAEGLCRYVDDKKISEWSKAAGVQFPLAVLQSDNNKILTKSELVNSQQVQKNQQRNIALETSKEKNMTELKTYHALKEEDVKNLEIISDEDFSDIVDSIILNDYKNIPNTIRLPNINSELAEKLGLEKDSAFIMKKSATHIRPDRKGSYGQAFDTEEYRMIPKVLREANFAVADNVFKNFQIVFDDENNPEKINKLIFNKDELGNYLVTIGKVDRESAFSEERNAVVAVGVAPTIQTLRTRASSTALRASTTTVNSNIAQNKEKSTIIQKNQPVLKYEDKIGKDNLEKIKKHFEKNIPDGAEKFKRLNISEARTVKEVVSDVKKAFGFGRLDKKYSAKLEKDFFDTCGIKVESKSDFIKRQNQNDRNQDAGKKDIELDNDYPDYTDDCGMDY
ncbi:MAG: SNF2-related protein [Treponema sp.]